MSHNANIFEMMEYLENFDKAIKFHSLEDLKKDDQLKDDIQSKIESPEGYVYIRIKNEAGFAGNAKFSDRMKANIFRTSLDMLSGEESSLFIKVNDEYYAMPMLSSAVSQAYSLDATYKYNLALMEIAKGNKTEGITLMMSTFLGDHDYDNEENYNLAGKEITNKDIYYPLEGYLFPDTYYFNGKDVSVKEIFKAMLDKMKSVLERIEIKTDLTTHELLTMASIVELEGKNSSARKDIASVFYNRIKKNISLGSDVTTYYAYGIDMGERDLKRSELNSYNPYNTRGPNMAGKLPIGPIASPSLSSIQAAAEPNETEYLFFVADKNGKVYFTRNNSEHEKMISNLKQQGLWYVYE